MAGVATVGMVPLMLATSVAVLVYFMHHREQADGRVGQTRLAPALACLGLLASLWLVLTNFTLVTGGSAALSTVLAAIPFAGLLVGALLWRPGAIDVGYRPELRYGIPRPGCSAGTASLKAFW